MEACLNGNGVSFESEGDILPTAVRPEALYLTGGVCRGYSHVLQRVEIEIEEHEQVMVFTVAPEAADILFVERDSRECPAI